MTAAYFFLHQSLQQGPAQTTGYMIAGFGVIFGVMAIYLISLYVRSRNLEQDLEMLEQIQERP